MEYPTIISNIRKLIITNPTLFSIIKNRFYPQRTPLQDLQYPSILVDLSITATNNDGYPVDEYLVDFYYISDTNIDVSHELSKLVHAILNMRRVTTDSVNFVCKQTTGPLDASDKFDGKLLYIVTNTYTIKAFSS